MSENLNGKTFSKQKILFPRENLKYAEFSSTLLIPIEYLDLLQSKIIKHKGIRSYVAYLLGKYQLHIANGLVPGYSNVTTKYQEKDLSLQKISFRPRPEDWAELKLYRISFGMSISAFFVYLLIADSVDFAETVSHYLSTVGIPVIANFDLTAKVYLWNQKTFYTKVFLYRKGKYY
ncbi:MAG TPA: DUF1564 family protein [Leptospiraceae bacterium]|nr:DUF1564 family protein [Leptospiraceae bacterium]HMX35337.1 DUF1564 family protein [Leptospiraceae bacterium]HMY34124.1 DUF1564 family protein [Leptospiraceae bacterium]HMZ63835.1 DUF1564 family protein [Leptospiraceae bacterium]HNA10214.1 DUF1564 family protein [Leptospiraceae bacterium]